MKTINDFNFKDKKALIRVDFNVPQDKDLNITDNTRILATKPTIDKILADGGSVILMTHLGRPDGKVVDSMSLKYLVDDIALVLGTKVKFAENCVGDITEKIANELKSGEILLLENLRFHIEEEKGNEEFAEKIAKLADIYVNDAFGTAHRKHASTAVIANYFKDNKCFGLLMANELECIEKVLKKGKKPVTAILGGAKVSSKITIIENILPAIDHLIIGGGMTYTFVKALGGNIGNSMVEDDKLELALSIIQKAKENNVTIHLPIDSLVADSFKNDASTKNLLSNAVEEGWLGLDIGTEAIKDFSTVIKHSKTILWNGPVGVFEMNTFSKGTIAIGNAIDEATKNGAFSLVGGGDSVAAVKQFGFENKVSYVSTGGGAMLESLEGIILPGVATILN